MAEYNKVYASLKPELPKVIQQEQIYVYAPRSSRAGMKNISSFNITSPVAAVFYDTTDGITVIGDSSLVSEEVSGEKLTQNFQSEFRIPVRPGKYINIDADADNNYVVIKVDDTALAKDYYKITRSSTANVPAYSPNLGVISLPYSYQNSGNSLVRRGSEGEAKFTYGIFGRWNDIDGGNTLKFDQIYRQLGPEQGTMEVAPTTGDKGTLLALILQSLRDHPLLTIRYKSQLYYRMDPNDAPDGTLNYIHIDSVQNGSGGYKATGKCFSITVSTRAWKVFDLDFDRSGIASINKMELPYSGYTAAESVDDYGLLWNGEGRLNSSDSVTGEDYIKEFNVDLFIPMIGSKYIRFDRESDKFVVSLNDENMSQDFIKIDKTTDEVIPQYINGAIKWTTVSSYNFPNWIAQRDGNGNCGFNNVLLQEGIAADHQGSYKISVQQLYFSCAHIYFTVAKTSTDTGTIGPIDFTRIQTYPNIRIIYNNQVYILQDPNNAPDGTLNYIHLDSVQDGAGGYMMTGKCFSITVSTRAWQVVDLSTRLYEHDMLLNDEASGTEIRFSLPLKTNSPFTNPEDLWNAMENKSNRICYVRKDNATEVGTITASMLSNSKVFQIMTGTVKNYTVNQLTISDAVY